MSCEIHPASCISQVASSKSHPARFDTPQIAKMRTIINNDGGGEHRRLVRPNGMESIPPRDRGMPPTGVAALYSCLRQIERRCP